MFYLVFLYYRRFIGIWFVAYCSVWFVIGLLRRDALRRFVVAFYLFGGDSRGKVDLISRRYQIMVVSLLKNWSHK